MRRRHLAGVVAVEDLCNPHPWSRRLFENELSQPGSRSLVAVGPHGVVVGFATLMVIGTEAHVTNLGVAPAARRNGTATRLLDALLAVAAADAVSDVTLEVRRSNEAAQTLYASFGFRSEGVRPRYYVDNAEDTVIMWRRAAEADQFGSAP